MEAMQLIPVHRTNMSVLANQRTNIETIIPIEVLENEPTNTRSKAISITEGETAYSNSYYYRGLAKLKLQKKSEARKDLKKAVKYGNIDAQKYIE